MISKIWIWISSIFPKSKIGLIFSLLFSNAANRFVKDILDIENQKKAYEFVKALNRNKDMTNREKARAFNKQMLEWSIKEGKRLAESTINCLRELAVNALKS